MRTPSFSNPSVMKHDFSRVPHADIPRSSFRRSHGYKTVLNTDYLYPIYVDEALPGDTFRLNMAAVARMNTPLFPLMDNLFMDFFFFAVPNRLLWTNWKRFMGERDPDPDSSIDFTVPVIETAAGGVVEGSLADYFGLPIGVHPLEFNSLHFRAYNMIWNAWFRDQNLHDSVTVDVDDGPDTMSDYVLLKRCKRHDYFTSCLPWPLKGGVEVDLPLGSSAPIEYWPYGTENNAMVVRDSTDDSIVGPHTLNAKTTTGELWNGVSGNSFFIDPNDKLYADLSGASGATLNSVREAIQLQRMLERDARGGTRYTEMIKSHFGVTNPDFRMQRPEYLGGGTKRVTVEPIPVTFQITGGTHKVGDLAGTGYSNMSGIGFSKSFTEHCVLIGLVNIRADLTYQTGIDRMWSRQTRYDYYFPTLAHLGEQEVLNKEIFAQGTADDDLVFGYQERWAEYRYAQSKITSAMRSAAAASLDAWHLSQDFGVTLPTLGTAFIEEAVPMDRVVAVDSEPDFNFDAFFDIVCARPMPMYSVPGLMDHF